MNLARGLIGLTSIHRRIFDHVFKYAGQLRKVELTKKEWVLGGETTVSYHPSFDLRNAVEHDLAKEKEYDYSDKLPSQVLLPKVSAKTIQSFNLIL